MRGEKREERGERREATGELALVVPVGKDLNEFEGRLAQLEAWLRAKERGNVDGGGAWQTARFWLKQLRAARLKADTDGQGRTRTERTMSDVR